ncbi:MAG: ABC transporter [Pseudonocardiales bacterium]|nr:MAG: ABC transporter [Pseudonocardiales bacterium]
MADRSGSASSSGGTGGEVISLQGLTKRFPGQRENAVDSLDLEIPAGEIVVLVGPSGCGKTTTMRMINRLIEPTSGKIVIGGEDVTKINSDQLRRRIGYVIQQVGLFPHMTIADNIAVVPRLLNWNKPRISERVDELLELVGLDAGAYRGRYPKELSGGQQQRVGVARALAVDPPVMLMDEPFGAIDPITRDRLQNEFLRLQETIRKTIVFVTHDIHEAIKLGDRIAILDKGSRPAQYDTPEQILAHPANDFVVDFIGPGASVRSLGLTNLADIELDKIPVVELADSIDKARALLARAKQDRAVIVDGDRRPRGWRRAADLEQGMSSGGGPLAILRRSQTVHDALNELLRTGDTIAAIVDSDGRYEGALRLETIMGLTAHADAARAPVKDAQPVAAQRGDAG